MKNQNSLLNNKGIADSQKLFMKKHILFPTLILTALLLSSCKSFPFAGQPDTKCARLIINTGKVSITHETVKEPSDTGITDKKNALIGKDITEDAIISIQPSENQETDEDTDMAVIDYTDYTDYDEDKIVDLDNEPVFPVQASEPQEIYEEAEDKILTQDDGPAVVSAQLPETGEVAVKKTAVDEIKDPETYLELAAAYSNEGKYEKALEAYRKASNISGADVPEIHYNLGLTYLMLDDRGSALKEYKILEDTDPVKADTLYRKTVEKVLSEKDNKFTVQVGAYKNITYAYETIKKLQKKHIHAYIKKENNFNKVRVPGIKTKKEGEAMIKELRETFGFRSVLLNAPQYP